MLEWTPDTETDVATRLARTPGMERIDDTDALVFDYEGRYRIAISDLGGTVGFDIAHVAFPANPIDDTAPYRFATVAELVDAIVATVHYHSLGYRQMLAADG